jgi:hypothetical protein
MHHETHVRGRADLDPSAPMNPGGMRVRLRQKCASLFARLHDLGMATKRAQTANTPVDSHWLLAGSVSLCFEEVQFF